MKKYLLQARLEPTGHPDTGQAPHLAGQPSVVPGRYPGGLWVRVRLGVGIFSLVHIIQALTGMDISATLSFTHHATNLASHTVE